MPRSFFFLSCFGLGGLNTLISFCCCFWLNGGAKSFYVWFSMLRSSEHTIQPNLFNAWLVDLTKSLWRFQNLICLWQAFGVLAGQAALCIPNYRWWIAFTMVNKFWHFSPWTKNIWAALPWSSNKLSSLSVWVDPKEEEVTFKMSGPNPYCLKAVY